MSKKNQFNHGGNVKEFSQKVGCKFEEVIDLSSNINFMKPNINCDFNKLEISSYPTYENLFESIAKKYSVKASEFEIFNGGSSAIFSFFRMHKNKNCIIYSPAYLEYKKAALINNMKINLINRFENLNENIPNKSLIVFVNPSTPDGKFYDLKKLFKLWIEKECTIFVDESFLEFCEGKSTIRYLKKYDKLYILKSLTKFYSSAGIRAGIIISNKANINKIKELEPLWKISSFDKKYLEEVLKDEEFVKDSILKTKQIKNYVEKELNKLNMISNIFNSNANFLLLKLNKIDSQTLQNELEKKYIMIRDCSNFDFLNNSYIRVAIKDKSSMEIFIDELKKIDKMLK